MPFANLGGTRFHYLDAGPHGGSSGVPLVLLHAFPLHSAMWEQQVTYLSRGRRVLAPDLKGFGRSDAPDDASIYAMESYADEVAALLSHLDIRRAVVGGLSMGGYVAFSLLRRHRSLLAGVILADTRASSDTAEVAERRTSQQEQVRKGKKDEVIDALLNGLLSENTRQNRPEVVERTRSIMESIPPAGFIGALEAMKNRPDASDELEGIDLPSLVIVGADDGLSPPDVARAMDERLPRSRLVELPNAGHLSNLEASEGFTAAVEKFLEEL